MEQLKPRSEFPRSQAAIAGLGYTEFSRDSGVSTFALAARAVKAAIEDAGLEVADIDGLATYGVNDSIAPNFLAQALGIQSLSYFVDQWGGGSVSQSVIGQAALAVSSGVADCIVCYRALNARSEYRIGGTGRAPVPFWDTQYKTPGTTSQPKRSPWPPSRTCSGTAPRRRTSAEWLCCAERTRSPTSAP